MLRPLALAVLAALVTLPAGAQTRAPQAPSGPLSPDSLAGITRRGRALAALDHAAWLGTSAMTLPDSTPDGVRRFLVRRTEPGWEVAAGALSAHPDTFFIAQLATPGMQRDQWAVSVFDPPRIDTGYFARAARAIETSLTMFQPMVRRPYIATAVPAEDGPWWWVYVYPAPREEGVWPKGGDMRFRISADGRVITESRRLHESITEYSTRTARSGIDKRAPATGNMPEDTDVFHVLQRRPQLPELMSAGRFRYRIDVDGSIRLLGNRE